MWWNRAWNLQSFLFASDQPEPRFRTRNIKHTYSTPINKQIHSVQTYIFIIYPSISISESFPQVTWIFASDGSISSTFIFTAPLQICRNKILSGKKEAYKKLCEKCKQMMDYFRICWRWKNACPRAARRRSRRRDTHHKHPRQHPSLFSNHRESPIDVKYKKLF